MARPSKHLLLFFCAAAFAASILIQLRSYEEGDSLCYSTPSHRVAIGLTPGRVTLLFADAASPAVGFIDEGLAFHSPDWSPICQPAAPAIGIVGIAGSTTSVVPTSGSPFIIPSGGASVARAVAIANVTTLSVPVFTFPFLVILACWAIHIWPRKPSTRNLAILCPACEYDLRASPKRCPECGWTRPKRGRVRPIVIYR